MLLFGIYHTVALSEYFVIWIHFYNAIREQCVSQPYPCLKCVVNFYWWKETKNEHRIFDECNGYIFGTLVKRKGWGNRFLLKPFWHKLEIIKIIYTIRNFKLCVQSWIYILFISFIFLQISNQFVSQINIIHSDIKRSLFK